MFKAAHSYDRKTATRTVSVEGCMMCDQTWRKLGVNARRMERKGRRSADRETQHNAEVAGCLKDQEEQQKVTRLCYV